MKLTKKLLGVTALAFAMSICAGVASLNVQADGEQALDGFAITDASVRIGNDTKENPSGLRFKTVVGENAATTYADAECYSTISFTSSVVTQANPNGDPVEYTANVPATSWRAEGDGWNTVLLEIPESDYGTEITVQSFIVTADATYATEKSTATIEYVASKVMQNGNDAEKLVEYTKNAVSAIELDKETATVQEGETLQLTATTDPEGFGVVWASDNESVATVDKNGKVSPVGAGSANITATMSGKTATCAVTVTAREMWDFETAGQVVLGDQFFAFGDGGVQQTKWKIIENVGEEGNHALLRNATDGWSRGMQLRLHTSWLKKVFATADYISLDFYTDAAPLEYLRWEGAANVKFEEGTLVGVDAGTVNDISVKKYSAVLMKKEFLASIDETTETSILRFMFTAPAPTVWCFDNVKFGSLNLPFYDFETADQVSLAENFAGCGGTGSVAKWALAENVGTTGNSALQKTDASYSTGMQFRVKTAWLDKVFATADYINFDVYTTSATMVYLRIDKTGGIDVMLYGANSGANIAGQDVGNGLYKYNFAIAKHQYTLAHNGSAAEEIVIRFNVTTKPTAWYFDNFNVVGTFDANTIDFANGQQTGAILGFVNGGNGHAQVAERTAGNYALQLKGASSSGDIYFAFNLAYLQYVFGELNAASIQFSIYCTGATTIVTGAFRTGNADASDSRNTTGVTAAIDANDSSKVNVTITKAAYEQWTLTSIMKVYARCSAAANGAFAYVDDITINK